MEIGKKTDWKLKVVFSILLSIVAIIALLFGFTYVYFARKLESSNEKIVRMAFRQSEKDLKGLIEKAERHLNYFYREENVWEFLENRFEHDVGRSIATVAVVEAFDERLALDEEIYGFAVLSGDGRYVVSSAEYKSRTGVLSRISEEMEALMQECKDNYPYAIWTRSKDSLISNKESLNIIGNRPVLLGMKAIGAASRAEEDTYILVTLDEKSVQRQYNMAVYNGSQALLVNGDNEILSGTEEALLGSVYQPDKANQNIEYELSYMGWKLVNMIPHKDYLKEVQHIRYLGIGIGLLASVAVMVIALIWSKRYIRPIQSLMDRMEAVGRDQLDMPRPEREGWVELDQLNEEFFEMVQKLKNHMHKLKIAEQEKAKEELLALQYQIAPHFLYNSLNSIRWMAMMTNNSPVADSLVILSKIITPICRNPSFTWKLSDELEFLENYVSMMNIRYADSVDYQVDCPKELYEVEFPRFILQPIVENCFQHGGTGKPRKHIHLSVKRSDKIYVEISNSSVYMAKERLDELNEMLQNGTNGSCDIGLSNIRKRLKLLYADSGRIWMNSVEGGVLIVHICF